MTLKHYLEQVRAQEGLQGDAQLFDQFVLFYTSSFVPKDAYPIPRHIVHFMLNLLDIRPEHHFADFTCGSGGFLVNTARRPERMIGVEISSDWRSIAVANAALHQLERPQIDFHLDNAFHACSPEGVLSNQTFHRIAMAPSFGRTIDKRLAQAVLADDTITTGVSEVLFTYMAYKKLAPGGRAVVMVPISLLTNRTGNALRQRLIDEHVLEAVITFQAGMLQPFNNERVALLLIQQKQKNWPPLEQCWFLNLEYDGYPRNPNRDLLSPPSLLENDLPLAQKVLHPEDHATEIENSHPAQASLDIQHQTAVPITLMQVPENATLVGLRHFAVQKNTQIKHFLLAQVQQNEHISLTAVSLQEQTLQPITDSVAWRRELYNIPEEVPPPEGDLLVEKAIAGQKLAITREGRLLGVSKAFSELARNAYSLITSDFTATTRETSDLVTNTSAHISLSMNEAISEAYQSAHILFLELSQIEQQISNLQGRLEDLETPGRFGEPLPPIQPISALILRYLGTKQYNHWEKLQPLVEVSLRGKDTYPIPFHPQQIEAPGMNQTEIAQLLQLLEHLGIVIKVSGNPSEGNGELPRVAYRRVSRRDIFPREKHPWE
ncbi:HsdM family class I SAM-dependent methyltransferase [Ktedonobacter robiniae]|uniref:HsdM family class I SAM-dependent methyltransferase n=1 Tax=Ktedonobacter robiniae TaxID=2778365 RepID=UPI00191608B9|nr:N-6 DNA methylase [Ktedonobacter robiniae]